MTENLNKKYKKIVGRLGKFLIATSNLSIAVIYWLCLSISEPVLQTFVFAVYIVAVELWCGSIVDIFKNGNGNHVEAPQ